MLTPTALNSYHLDRLPIGIFVDLSTAAALSNDSPAKRLSTAKQLHSAILQKLKQNSTLVPSKRRRRRRWTTSHRISSRYLVEGDSHRNKPSGTHAITTVAALLQEPPFSLMLILDPLLSLSECITFYQRICEHCSPLPKTAKSLLGTPWQESNQTSNAAQHLSTGWGTMDRALRGGLRLGTMTELVGAAGTAKTQLALQTTIVTAAPSFSINDENQLVATSSGGTIWVDTEQKVSIVRLQEIAQSRYKKEDVQTILENVTVHYPSTMTEFWHLLNDTLETELESRNAAAQRRPDRHWPVRLIVIDSIAAPLRREEATAAQQTTTLMQIAQQLKRIADQYQLAILIINQVTSSSASSHSMSSGGNPKEPTITTTTHRAALGTAWHHCVTTRIELQQQSAEDARIPPQRQARVVKSVLVETSHAPIPFQVTKQGVVDIPD